MNLETFDRILKATILVCVGLATVLSTVAAALVVVRGF